MNENPYKAPEAQIEWPTKQAYSPLGYVCSLVSNVLMVPIFFFLLVFVWGMIFESLGNDRFFNQPIMWLLLITVVKLSYLIVLSFYEVLDLLYYCNDCNSDPDISEAD